MPATSSLLKKLANDHPQFIFAPGSPARWSPDNHTVYYDADDPQLEWNTLHELAHALLNHTNYTRDIELLKIESQAWEYARDTLAPHYALTIDQTFIDEQIDTYRDWLHTKSTCPHCGSSGVETTRARYTCPHCGSTWHTNTGIDVAIRRYKK